jgi:hypothetical protein
MATLHSITSGSFSSASTWGLVDPVSLVDSIAAIYTLTTTPTNSNAFLPGAQTIKGISLAIQSRSITPSGTMTVSLNTSGGVLASSVTINVADLPSTGAFGTPYIGWTYFQFATPVTLAAATNYVLKLSTSVASMVTVYVTAANNYSRALVTATTLAPAASDSLLISGQHTAAGTFTPYIVTMDITSSATTYGQIAIGTRGTLSYGVATGTNYALKIAGMFYIGQGGVFNIGATGAPIPSTSTATLEILCTSALQYFVWVYGTMNTYGATKSVASKLAADVASVATSSTTTTATGWKSGDIIIVPSTTRTYSEYEAITLNTDAVGTTLTHGAYVNAHGGNATTKVQADIVNSTRNIIIKSSDTTFRTCILIGRNVSTQVSGASVTSFYYTKFQDLGTGIVATNAGIGVNILTTGTFDFQYNVVTTTVVQSAILSANSALITSSSAGTTISNNLFYKLGWTATVVSTIFTTIINNNNYFIGCLSSSQILRASAIGSGNVVASNGATSYGAFIDGFFNNANNNSFYSNSGQGVNWAGLSISTIYNTNITELRIWRNLSNGLVISNTSVNNRTQVFTVSDSYIFGNGITGIVSNNRTSGKFYFNNCYIYGGPTLVQPYGVGIINTYVGDTIYFDNCYFGYSDSSLTSSVLGTSTITNPIAGVSVIFSNCKFNTQADVTYGIVGYPMTNAESSYTSLKHNGVTGSNRIWYSNGALSTDSIIYNTSSPSVRMSVVTSTYKLTSPTVKIPVKSGKTCSVSVNVRKSTTIGSDTIYNGNQPRLMYSFNPSIGNLTETVGVTFFNLNLIYVAQQDFNNASYWTKTSTTTTINQTNSPDSRLTATKLVVTNGVTFGNTTTNLLSGPNTYNIGDIYTFSIYARKELFDVITIVQGQSTALGGAAQVTVNLNNGVIISSSGTYVSPTVETLLDGWYRISVTKEIPGTANNRYAIVPGSTIATAGNGTSGIYIWGAQIIQGTDPGVYTPSEDWQKLTYTTPAVTGDGVAEFYVDCDGTTGWVNFDDWSTTTLNDSRGTDFWNPSGTYVESTWRKPGGTQTFIN